MLRKITKGNKDKEKDEEMIKKMMKMKGDNN